MPSLQQQSAARAGLEKRIEDAHSNGDTEHVVAKSADKVLADIAHGGAADFDGSHDAEEAALDERHIACLDSHVGN